MDPALKLICIPSEILESGQNIENLETAQLSRGEYFLEKSFFFPPPSFKKVFFSLEVITPQVLYLLTKLKKNK